MSSIMSTRTFLLRSTRLMTSHKANLSKSALVFSDIQLKEANEKDTARSMTKPPSGLVTVECAPNASLPSGVPEEKRKQMVVRIPTEGISVNQF